MLFTVPNSYGVVHESNDCHGPHDGKFCSSSGVPAAPGSTPLPAGHIRAYHYTNALDAVLTTGLSRDFAKGRLSGEPNAIWFSTHLPDRGKHFVEVHLRPDEIAMGGPGKTQAEIDRFNTRGGNFTAAANLIPPSRIVTHSRPWHEKYRGLMEDYPPDNTKVWGSMLKAYDGSVERMIASYEKIGGEYAKAVALWAKEVRKHRG